MVRVIVGVIVLVGVAVAIIYYVGGTRSFDPTAQGRQAQAAIQPGMTWQQVVDVAGKPGRYHTILEKRANGIVTYQRGAAVRFDRDLLTGELASRVHTHGFVFTYMFSAQSKFSVDFDAKGNVRSVQDEPTLADLLDQRQ